MTLTSAEKRQLRIIIPDGFLRPLLAEDVHAGYVDGLNDPAINRYLVAVRQQRQTMETVRNFVRHDDAAADAILFGIWLNGAATHCGTVRLHSIRTDERTAALGICIFDQHAWGHAVGSAAINAVTQWALHTLGLDSISAGTYLDNVASWKAFLKVGYVITEDIHDRYQRDGEAVVVRMLSARRDNV